MKRTLKVAMVLGLVLMALLAAGIVSAAKKPLPEYVGSQACLGCHADRWQSWAGSRHNMVQAIRTTADIPGWDKATPEQKAELLKADFVLSEGRFLARDNATGNLVFLKYEWMHEEGVWIDYDEPDAIWQNQCYGCHITPQSKAGVANQPAEWGIGCEDCHGPGREHILSKGDPSKIVLNTSSDVCGQCHNSGYKMADNRWIYGYRPNMKLTDVPGIIMPAVDPTQTANKRNHINYPQWVVSGHGPKAVADLKANSHATGACYECHTQEAFAAKEEGETFTYDPNASYVAISCVTCHRPHGLGLVNEKELCITCHTGSIAAGTSLKPGATPHHPMKEFFAGYGAAGGIVSTGNPHAEVLCQECHMANTNHLMQVVRPDDPGIKEGSVDACTSCHQHEGDARELRAAYLNMWEDFTTSKLDALNKDVAAIDAAVKAGKVLTADQKTKLDTVKTNIAFINADGSKGAHNFNYATKIISAAQKDLAALKAAVTK